MISSVLLSFGKHVASKLNECHKHDLKNDSFIWCESKEEAHTWARPGCQVSWWIARHVCNRKVIYPEQRKTGSDPFSVHSSSFYIYIRRDSDVWRVRVCAYSFRDGGRRAAGPAGWRDACPDAGRRCRRHADWLHPLYLLNNAVYCFIIAAGATFVRFTLTEQGSNTGGGWWCDWDRLSRTPFACAISFSNAVLTMAS